VDAPVDPLLNEVHRRSDAEPFSTVSDSGEPNHPDAFENGL
jgi:hypothetical protein